MKIFISGDHAGFELKKYILANAAKLPGKVEFVDLGPSNCDSVDYPDYAEKLCEALIKENKSSSTDQPKALGVLICGSGVGVSIAANRHPEIRAVLAESELVAKLSREHNHANVLCMGARIVSNDLAIKILTTFLTATPDTGERHVRRVQKLCKG